MKINGNRPNGSSGFGSFFGDLRQRFDDFRRQDDALEPERARPVGYETQPSGGAPSQHLFWVGLAAVGFGFLILMSQWLRLLDFE